MTLNSIIEMIQSTEINLVGAIFKLLLSMILGAIIGLQRHHKGQFAGMRTFALICMGATMAMLVSIFIPQEYMGLKNGDPGRIAAQVVSGIGFLGAGAIIQMKGSVKGLTTAAGIWMTASIGLAIGAGMYIIAVGATLLIMLVLSFAEFYEMTLFGGRESRIIRIKTSAIVNDMEPYRKLLGTYKIHIQNEFIRFNYADNQTIINFVITCHGKTDFVKVFGDIHNLGNIVSVTLASEVNN